MTDVPCPTIYVAPERGGLRPWQRLRWSELAVLGRYLLLRARHPGLRGGPFSVGRGAELRLGPRARVRIGRGVRLARDFSASVRGDVQIGDHVFFNRGCTVVVYSQLSIGAHSLFGEYVSIHDESHIVDATATPVAARGYTAAPISIGRNVWVGAKATILSGVTIGDGAVIGCNAVVTRPIPARVLAVGAPARVVREI